MGPTDLQCCQAKKVQDYFQKPRIIRIMHSTVSSLCNEIFKSLEKIHERRDIFFFIENPVSFHNSRATQRNPSVYYYIRKRAWHRHAKSHAHSRYIALLDDHMCTKVFCNIKK